MARITTTLLLATLALGLAHTAQEKPSVGAWHVLPDSPMHDRGGRHDDVFFTDPDTGWVVNVRGEIYKTTNGGQSWVKQLDAEEDLDTIIPFRSVGFANSQVGWVGSLIDQPLLFETRDGGDTWTDITDRITGPMPKGLCGLWVVNEHLIYGAGRFVRASHFIKSTDGGQSWTSTDMTPYAATLVDVFFFDEKNGIVVGGTNAEVSKANAVVLMTSDGGDTWQTRHTTTGDLGEWGWKISFPTPTTGYVAVENHFNNIAKVLKTTDGGMTWEEIVIENNHFLLSVGFVSEEVGWAGGGGVTWMTETGGRTWQQVEHLDGRVNRFRMFNDTLGYAVGRQVYKYTR